MKKNIFKLSKPFTFEGETYTELNIAAFQDITGQQLCDVERTFKKQYTLAAADYDALEFNLNYIFLLCSFVLNKPVEFFQALPAVDTVKLKYKVIRFLAGVESEESEDLNEA